MPRALQRRRRRAGPGQGRDRDRNRDRDRDRHRDQDRDGHTGSSAALRCGTSLSPRLPAPGLAVPAPRSPAQRWGGGAGARPPLSHGTVPRAGQVRVPGWRGGQEAAAFPLVQLFLCLVFLPRKQRPEGSAEPGHVLREGGCRTPLGSGYRRCAWRNRPSLGSVRRVSVELRRFKTMQRSLMY